MRTLKEHIFERLKVSKSNISNITLDTFKHGIKLYDVAFLRMQTISYNGHIYINYYSIKDKSKNTIAYVENFDEGDPIYTLIVPDDTYDYFCNEFDLEEADEYGFICPEELYNILFYKIPDFPSECNIYLTSVSIWLDERENLFSKNDSSYITFRDTYKEIKNKLSNNGNI